MGRRVRGKRLGVRRRRKRVKRRWMKVSAEGRRQDVGNKQSRKSKGSEGRGRKVTRDGYRLERGKSRKVNYKEGQRRWKLGKGRKEEGENNKCKKYEVNER